MPLHSRTQRTLLLGFIGSIACCGLMGIYGVLHRVSAIPLHRETHTTELMLSLTCPRCARTQVLPAGRSTCVLCHLKFCIEIEEEHCRTCGYVLYKLASGVCPECGTAVV